MSPPAAPSLQEATATFVAFVFKSKRVRDLLTMAASAPSSDEASTDERPARSRVSLLLERIFRSCDEDPKGSVHKAWGLALIFVFVYFIISVVESKSMSLTLFSEWIPIN